MIMASSFLQFAFSKQLYERGVNTTSHFLAPQSWEDNVTVCALVVAY